MTNVNNAAPAAKAKRMSLLTPTFRVSYPHLFQPYSMPGTNNEPKFSVVMIFDKDADLGPLKQAIQATAIAKWGPDKTKWPTLKPSPLHSGDKDKPGVEEVKGKFYATASCKPAYPPGVVDGQKNPIMQASELYAGCYARALVSVYAYDKVGRGVAIGLQHVQKVKDGEPLGGGIPVENAFDAIEQGPAMSEAAADDALNAALGDDLGGL